MHGYQTFQTIAGPALLVLGIWLLYRMGRRRFNRRNAMGVQVFPSYSNSLLTRGAETLIRLLGWVFVLAGAGLVLRSYMGRG